MKVTKKTKLNTNDKPAEPITVTAPIPANIWQSELEGLHELAMLTNRSFEELLGEVIEAFCKVSLDPELEFAEKFPGQKSPL